ncbi:MAG: hypothetical protein H6839_15760 [Planctomycetes bacterium]|nr:hypothetical protein [Planctomycetota bacterium]
MSTDAIQLYQKLVKDHGMPECKTLMQLGNQWYETPEEANSDPNEAISTAVFRLLPQDQLAKVMADHAFKWAATFAGGAKPDPDPVKRLQQVVALAGKR